MPFVAIFGTAAEIGLRVDTAVFKPKQTVGIEARVESDVETSVAIEVYGVLSVGHHILVPHGKHRHLSAVGRGIEHLLCDIILGIEAFDFGLMIECALSACNIIFEECRRINKRRESIIDLIIVAARRHSHSSVGRKLYLAHHLTGFGIEVCVV